MPGRCIERETMTAWNRLQWGVEFIGLDGVPILIGSAWHSEACRKSYPGEPTRALLFCSRQQARAWCAAENARYAAREDLRSWHVRPVRVRETVAHEG